MSERRSQTDELDQNPIITYTNRLQKQMIIITDMLYNGNIPPNALKIALRGLIANLPPIGKKALKKEYEKLTSNEYLNKPKLEAIYDKTHDWAYTKLFQDTFRLKPFNPEIPHIGLRKDETGQ
jgi:hypothetical protein